MGPVLREYKGAAMLLKKEIGDKLKVFYCMAHRLELAVNDALKSTNGVSRFQMLVDTNHRNTNLRLKNKQKKFVINFRRITRVFDVRWVFSSYLLIAALLQDLPALREHLQSISNDSTRNTKERSKCSGLVKKISN